MDNLPVIYTSYYARGSGLPGATAISIVRPRWASKIQHYPDLAPSPELLSDYKSKVIGVREYVVRFHDLLQKRKLDPHTVAEELEGRVLLCYEKPCDFCHRHLVARWLWEENSARVFELTKGGEATYKPMSVLEAVMFPEPKR